MVHDKEEKSTMHKSKQERHILWVGPFQISKGVGNLFSSLTRGGLFLDQNPVHCHLEREVGKEVLIDQSQPKKLSYSWMTTAQKDRQASSQSTAAMDEQFEK